MVRSLHLCSYVRRTHSFLRHACWFCLALVVNLIIPGRSAARTSAPLSGVIDGIVTTQNGTIPLGGALVVVQDQSGRELTSLSSDGAGEFHVADLPPGTYTIAVSLEGFVTARATTAIPRATKLTIDLAIASLSDTVEVVAPATIVSTADTLGKIETVTSSETDQLASGGGLQAALRLLASVIEVPGGLSIKGGRPTQAGVQIGATTLTDPAMGLAHVTLPDDAIDSVAVLPNPYAVEYGRFSSGLVVIRTRRAGDRWKIRLNNLDPTFRTKRHAELYSIKGIASFGPRLELGGPIVKDRLFVQEAAQYRYSTADIPSRPEDERRTTQWFSSFTRADANLSARHSMIAMAGWFPSVTTMASLGTFVPPAATVDVHERVNHLGATERSLWRDALVGETTVQVHDYRTELNGQGAAPMELWPDTTLGNFYNSQRRTPATVQLIETLSGSANGGATGLHLFKFGVDILYNRYDGMSASRPVLVRRENGTLARRLEFTRPSAQQVRSSDIAFFAQDRVQPTTRWFAEYGARVDRDGVLARWNVTPRIGAAVLLNQSGSAVVRGGFGLFYERTPSAAGAFNQFETAIDSRFAADGITLLGPPVPFVHVIDPDLRTARSATWDLSYDHRLTTHWSVLATLLERHGTHELIVDSQVRGGESRAAAALWSDRAAAPSAAAALEWSAGALRLASEGRSRYRPAEFGVRYTQGTRADITASYARATAESDLNAFANYFDTMMWPIVGANAYGPAITDVPHRVMAKARVMPAERWLLLGILDWRTGLPYSVMDEALDFIGPRNSMRFPNRFHLDLGVERKFHILKWQPWIGVRAYNALNSFVPMDVQANVGSPHFGSFYNSEYRQLRLQLRFER
jgi:hypothetical protein